VSDTVVAPTADPASAPPRPKRRPHPRHLVAPALLLVLALIPLNKDEFWDQFGLYFPLTADRFWLQLGLYAFAVTVAALGLTLLVGQAGQLSLGHSFFMLVGAYSYIVLAGTEKKTKTVHWIGFEWPPILAMVCAVLIAGLCGLLFTPIAARLRGIYLGIASLGLVFGGRHLLLNVWPELSGGSNARDVPKFELLGLRFVTPPDPAERLYVGEVPLGREDLLWYLFLAVTIAAFVYYRNLVNGRPGRALRAVRDRELMAGIVGVPVTRYKGYAFLISSMYAGLGGVLYALAAPSRVGVDEFGFAMSIELVAMVVIGGLGSPAGAVFGAVFVWCLKPVLGHYAENGAIPFLAKPGEPGLEPGVAATFVFGAALVVLLLIEPGGAAAVGRRLARVVRRSPAAAVPPKP
jgi:branched-chain amino acid transport system permease protein